MARILIIDDYLVSLEAIASILRNGGHEVITACNEEDAFRSCQRYAAPDVMLVDVQLPARRDGAQVARELMLFYPEASVVFISGTPLDQLQRDKVLDLSTFPAHRTRFLEKPFSAAQLTSSIDEALGAATHK
jgi:CheY-like chemotaxis protein